jgi:hypothetical protein
MQYIIQITNLSGSEDVSYFKHNYEYLPALTKKAQVFSRENSAVQAAYDLSDMHPDYIKKLAALRYTDEQDLDDQIKELTKYEGMGG